MKRLIHLLRQAFILPIRLYQGTISRVTPATCRFKPTCSQYAVEAVECHGIWRGSLYTIWRLLRCNPFVEGGWDPIPTKRKACEHGEESGER